MTLFTKVTANCAVCTKSFKAVKGRIELEVKGGGFCSIPICSDNCMKKVSMGAIVNAKYLKYA